MIKSMTGFASLTREDDRATITVTIRALNHRYLDLQLRIPQSLAAIESDVRALVNRRVARGRVELSLSLQLRHAPSVEVEFNEEFGRALETALDLARARGLVNGALTPGDLLRLPQALTIRERQTESDVRALVGRRVARGRVELSLSLQLRHAPSVEVEFNEEFGRALETALDLARARGLVNGALTPGDLLRLPQALTIRERQTESDDAFEAEIAERARVAVDQALLDLDVMRGREGDHVRADLDQRRLFVADLVERIARAADEGRGAMEERLRERVRELRTELQADETAVAQEIVKIASRSDISEEVTRFRGHVAHWATLADSDEPCGR